MRAASIRRPWEQEIQIAHLEPHIILSQHTPSIPAPHRSLSQSTRPSGWNIKNKILNTKCFVLHLTTMAFSITFGPFFKLYPNREQASQWADQKLVQCLYGQSLVIFGLPPRLNCSRLWFALRSMRSEDQSHFNGPSSGAWLLYPRRPLFGSYSTPCTRWLSKGIKLSQLSRKDYCYGYQDHSPSRIPDSLFNTEPHPLPFTTLCSYAGNPCPSSTTSPPGPPLSAIRLSDSNNSHSLLLPPVVFQLVSLLPCR